MKKKVLQVLGGIGFGGAEAFVMNQFRNLQDEYIFDFAVQVHFDAEQSYENEIKQLGGKIYYTGLFRSSPLKYAKQIANIVKNNGPYVAVHIHVNEQCGFASLGARSAFNGNVVVHAHSSQYGQKNPVIKALMLCANKFLVRYKANQIVACSEDAASMYFGKHGKRMGVILKNPIAVDRFFYSERQQECRAKLGIMNSSLVILHIGRFIDVKNHEFIVRICKKLSEMNVDYTMLLVGDGVMRDHIQKMVDEQCLNDRVKFLGERSDIPAIFAASDVMILPSKYEGLPTVVLEAQASGTHCVVSANVSRSCDIGIGLVDFVDIDGSLAVNEWANKVQTNNEKLRNIELINTGFANHEISLDGVSSVLKSFYQ